MEKLVHTSIRPKKRWSSINFKELFQYKDLLYFMVLRDVTVLYKQTILGFAWAVINPVFSMLVFTIVFGRLANVPSDGIPYPIFSYAALIPWTYFAAAMNASSTSLVSTANIFTKVYFPRIIIPLTPVLSKLMDFAISFMILIVMLFYYRLVPGINILYLPILIVIMITTAAGIGMWLSALAIQYRDVKFAITFVTPLMMYAAPVVFPSSLILEKFGSTAYTLYGLYPMVGVIEGFRAAFVSTKIMPWDLILMGGVSASILFITGLLFFNNLERKFADVA
ncbi:MAG: ABC transporter permease [Saprospiraceae bacterium]|nr:ABC transporter permease [Saprospiraceae bacterium]